MAAGGALGMLPHLLTEHIKNCEAKEYHEYIKDLKNQVKVRKSKSAKLHPVPSIRYYKGKRTIIKVVRDPKFVTMNELNALVKYYKVDLNQLIDEFTKRKIPIQE